MDVRKIQMKRQRSNDDVTDVAQHGDVPEVCHTAPSGCNHLNDCTLTSADVRLNWWFTVTSGGAQLDFAPFGASHSMSSGSSTMICRCTVKRNRNKTRISDNEKPVTNVCQMVLVVLIENQSAICYIRRSRKVFAQEAHTMRYCYVMVNQLFRRLPFWIAMTVNCKYQSAFMSL